MNNKHGALAVRSMEDGSITNHAGADPGGGYGTLCGLSIDDDCFEVADTPDNARINCEHCHAVWKVALSFKSGDFAPKDQRKNP